MREQTSVKELFEKTGITKTTIERLVQTRQSRVQSSSIEDWGEDQTTLENKIRQGTDHTSLDRVETGSEINVANANDEGLRTRIGGSDDDHAKVEAGELTEEEAQAMMNGTTLRPPTNETMDAGQHRKLQVKRN